MVEEDRLYERASGRKPGADLPRFRRGRLWRYGPVVVWAALIFIGSSDLLSASHTSVFLRKPLHWLFPGVNEATLIAIHFTLRKLAHFTEYAILALLAARALRSSSHETFQHGWFLISLVFVALYALSDEFHQSFVSTRMASIFDSLIDTAGGLTALIVAAIRERGQNRER
jgi:VanZ family protein